MHATKTATATRKPGTTAGELRRAIEANEATIDGARKLFESDRTGPNADLFNLTLAAVVIREHLCRIAMATTLPLVLGIRYGPSTSPPWRTNAASTRSAPSTCLSAARSRRSTMTPWCWRSDVPAAACATSGLRSSAEEL